MKRNLKERRSINMQTLDELMSRSEISFERKLAIVVMDDDLDSSYRLWHNINGKDCYLDKPDKEHRTLSLMKIDGRKDLVTKVAKGEMTLRDATRFYNKNLNPETEYVYFIGAVDTGLVKIGYTKGDVEFRLAMLQIGSPIHLYLIGALEGGKETETKLHKRFKSFHSHGEWYRIEGELKTYLEN